MPITHIVTLTFKADTPRQAITELAAGLDALGRQVRATAFQHGFDLSLRDGNADYAITAVFESQDQFREHMQEPLHQKIIRDLLMPHMHSKSTVQFQTPLCDGTSVDHHG
jgi:quinol monooxygenase YgiN